MAGYTYIITNKQNGTLYIGVASDLVKRIYEHKTKAIEGFSSKHNLDRLVFFEQYDRIEDAILREKRLKKWNRSWKIKLVSEQNPEWNDLYEDITQ